MILTANSPSVEEVRQTSAGAGPALGATVGADVLLTTGQVQSDLRD